MTAAGVHGMSRWDRTMITLAHWGRTLLVAVGVVVVAGYALPLPAGRAAVCSVLVLANVVSWRHARLYPWCPHCRRWDDGGRREPSPDPDPTASPERVR